jgi:hypothetical protein
VNHNHYAFLCVSIACLLVIDDQTNCISIGKETLFLKQTGYSETYVFQKRQFETTHHLYAPIQLFSGITRRQGPSIHKSSRIGTKFIDRHDSTLSLTVHRLTELNLEPPSTSFSRRLLGSPKAVAVVGANAATLGCCGSHALSSVCPLLTYLPISQRPSDAAPCTDNPTIRCAVGVLVCVFMA